MRQLTTEELVAKYGKPNEAGTYLVSTPVPFPLVIAWDKTQTTNKIRCHKLEAATLTKIFTEILADYTLPRIQELRINLYGGCFNFRQMRGGTEWSHHAFGSAIDLDPERNQLKENHLTARFARFEYKKMIDIFEANGWLSLGRLRDYDWMHFERGGL